MHTCSANSTEIIIEYPFQTRVTRCANQCFVFVICMDQGRGLYTHENNCGIVNNKENQTTSILGTQKDETQKHSVKPLDRVIKMPAKVNNKIVYQLAEALSGITIKLLAFFFITTIFWGPSLVERHFIYFLKSHPDPDPFLYHFIQFYAGTVCMNMILCDANQTHP